MMEAVCRGFVSVPGSKRGMTIGLLPSEHDGWANRYVEIPIATGMGYARNAIIARAASAVVAVGGCSGTLSEMAFAWQAGRPIVALSGTGGWAERLAGQAVDDRRADSIFSARTVDEAIEFLKPKLSRK